MNINRGNRSKHKKKMTRSKGNKNKHKIKVRPNGRQKQQKTEETNQRTVLVTLNCFPGDVAINP